MRTTVALVLFAFAFRLHADILAPPIIEKEWSVESIYVTLHPKQFISTMSRERLVKTPSWNQVDENPPLSPRKAKELALAQLDKIVQGKNWEMPDIGLKAFNVSQHGPARSDEDVRWIYVLTFGLLGTADYEGGHFKIIVLMDGTVVEPKGIPFKAEK
jgi:hypothetical protein